MKVNQVITKKAKLINQTLEELLPMEEAKPKKLSQAMRYSVLAGGKRLRPILTLLVAKLIGEEEKKVLPAACALEMIHNYSLIHDDLPCMDDDDYRRGQPTNHKVYGEAMAVLAGDSLLTLAFETISRINNIDQDKVLLATQELAIAAGNQGMVGGQAADIVAEGQKIDKEGLEYIHTHKTGALLRAAVRIGAILAGANKEELAALTTYAQKIGLAFQVVDDILDIEGDEEKLGKDVGSDLERDKATFPALYGLEEAKKMAQKLCQEAKEAIHIFGEEAKVLLELADYIIGRDY
ncbi:geranylgeranyl pyrophosphate synthase [Halobacteroides halobius DSM 5150]|uniref:Farnesyl diphosphate synthase n=1 Tax=Halobacteroides halobius (strain ATCC 35273 / DSM 5150 / MD-1) TaxID=748449 RepID=L0K7L0_HALHC|nr:farnesyl diphosphate synthase [Halobacteroides halobius]AGB40535.1 geranylgeranyl pyrophosphate synthase [Halobacteroides halobius DSM 5150]